MPATSAVVIGGSLAGMCAARVLSDCVDKVTIIERDAYPAAPDFRAGVPQARHVHNLLARGLREFESFFPGFEARMRERGAVPVESGWDTATLWPHGWARRAHTGLWQLYASRPLIEGTVREFCRSLPNVTFLERTEVSALRATGGSRRECVGVEVRTRDDGQTRTLEADLVVDASGAHSKSGEWLQQLGLTGPEEEIVEGHTGYSSRWFASDQAWPSDWWWKVLFLRLATPERPYFVGFFPMENRRWLLSYIGVNKSYPPRGEAEFTAALEDLASPVVHEMVRRMEPVSPIYSGRATRNRWRHYERWRTPLARFIAIADAACSFNPRFGQGMSAATVSARLLQECLARYGVADASLPRAFFAAQARFQRTPWLFSAADDLRLPMSEGNRSVSIRLFNWYRPQVVSCPDGQVGARLGQVTQFLRPMSSLFSPPIVSRVLLASTKRQLKGIRRRAGSSGVAPMPPAAE
ncbi:MAG: FAD-dependent monooxygenase [Reyranella sp.]|nr:FAD-dependent monooxygenase [Reyranella sp.]